MHGYSQFFARMAGALHLGTCVLVAAFGAALVYAVAERRGRPAWAHSPFARSVSSGGGPYRSSGMITTVGAGAPALVRLASLVCFAVGQLFVPALLLAVIQFRFDGVAIAIIPGAVLSLVNVRSGWLMLTGSPTFVREVSHATMASLIANVGLLSVLMAHFALGADRIEEAAHAHSSPVVYVGVAFALASIGQALLILAALRTRAVGRDPQTIAVTTRPTHAFGCGSPDK